MTKIFISYRRDDTGFGADRVHEAALDYVSNPADVFMDIDGIPPGADVDDFISERVSECDVLFALIGRDWLEIQDPISGLRRLEDPSDFVRIEIASALARNIPVVPLLMGEAPMPPAQELPDNLKPLARRNASRVGRASFKTDMARLMTGLGIARAEVDSQSLLGAADDTQVQHRTFALIESSLSRTEYRRFLDRYPDGPEAFEAERRISQLESWADLDRTDPIAIESWLMGRSDRVFDALENTARDQIKRAGKAKGAASADDNGRKHRIFWAVLAILLVGAVIWGPGLTGVG